MQVRKTCSIGVDGENGALAETATEVALVVVARGDSRLTTGGIPSMLSVTSVLAVSPVLPSAVFCPFALATGTVFSGPPFTE